MKIFAWVVLCFLLGTLLAVGWGVALFHDPRFTIYHRAALGLFGWMLTTAIVRFAKLVTERVKEDIERHRQQ